RAKCLPLELACSPSFVPPTKPSAVAARPPARTCGAGSPCALWGLTSEGLKESRIFADTAEGDRIRPGRPRGRSTRIGRGQVVGAAPGPVGARARESENLDRARIHRRLGRGRVPAAQPLDGTARGIGCPTEESRGDGEPE